MTRHVIGVGLLWAVLTAVGVFLAVNYDLNPQALSDKGEEIDHAFQILMIMAMPVFMLPIAVLIVNLFSSRSGGDAPPEDGPPLHGRGSVPLGWFIVTGALTLLVMVYPGLTSLGSVFGRSDETRLNVDVAGAQWTWLISYPDDGVTNVRELVVPVNWDVSYRITSLDVVHSFWVPAFRMKIDAVPGLTSHMTMIATEEGDFESDPMLRLQCAELCGLSHSRMQIPVRVVSETEFQDWLAENRQSSAPSGDSGAAVTLDLVASGNAFDKDSLEAPAGEPFDVALDNQDEGIPHNFSVYEDQSAKDVLFQGDLIKGPDTITNQLPGLEAATYYFQCDFHPATMNGTLTVQ